MRVFLFLLFFVPVFLFGQAGKLAELPETDDFPVDENVSYKDGNDRINKIIGQNLKYPPKAIKDKVGGTVRLYFTIDTLGHPRYIQVLKSVRADIDSEAIRCVNLLNEWVPRNDNGRKACLHHTLSIKFEMK